MIGKLTGTIDSIASDHALIDVGGVGYVVFASQATLAKLPNDKTIVSLLIETNVREDHIHLYGFATTMERDWFRILTTVQGVGNKVALAILSLLSPDALTTALAAQDKAAFQRVDGVGPKLAARLLTELKDRAPVLDIASFVPLPAGQTRANDNNVLNDAVSALVNLGYGRSEAYSAAAATLQNNTEIDLSNLIRNALNHLSGTMRSVS